MQIVEVADKKSAKQFIDVARIIYKGDPNFVCPLDGMIEAIFDPSKNTFFMHGECIRWILKDDNGKLIGRTAAFINRNKAYNYDVPVGDLKRLSTYGVVKRNGQDAVVIIDFGLTRDVYDTYYS